MTKRLLALYLVLVVLLAAFIPGCTPTATGTIEVKATLDGAPWPSSGTGAVNYTLTGPVGTASIDGTEVPKTHSNIAPGSWTCAYVSGGPGIFVNITPSQTQSVAADETKTFTLNFRTPEPPDAWVTFKSWTINGQEVDPAQGPFIVTWNDFIDCEYTEHVEGEQGEVVTVHQTSWLKIHNNGFEGEPGPSIFLHVVNHPDAVKMNPPAPKQNQTCTVGGVPVPECTEIELQFCDWVDLDVEMDWDLVICTNYTKTINWIGFPPPIMQDLPVLFDVFTGGLLPFQTLQLVSYACVEVEGDENTDNDCCEESPMLTVMYMPPI